MSQKFQSSQVEEGGPDVNLLNSLPDAEQVSVLSSRGRGSGRAPRPHRAQDHGDGFSPLKSRKGVRTREMATSLAKRWRFQSSQVEEGGPDLRPQGRKLGGGAGRFSPLKSRKGVRTMESACLRGIEEFQSSQVEEGGPDASGASGTRWTFGSFQSSQVEEGGPDERLARIAPKTMAMVSVLSSRGRGSGRTTTPRSAWRAASFSPLKSRKGVRTSAPQAVTSAPSWFQSSQVEEGGPDERRDKMSISRIIEFQSSQVEEGGPDRPEQAVKLLDSN